MKPEVGKSKSVTRTAVNRRLRKTRWVLDGLLALGLLGLVSGCAYPANYQEWQWKQWNPNYVPLPGEPNR